MTTTTLVSQIALSVALVQLAFAGECDLAQDMGVYAAKHQVASHEEIAIVLGDLVARCWIEQDTASSYEELHSGDPERFTFGQGDTDTFKAAYAALASTVEDQEDDFLAACCDATRAAWRAHYEAMHAAYKLGKEHGKEHAEEWISEWRGTPTPSAGEKPTEDETRADYDDAIKTLRGMASKSNDWSTSAAEGWSLTGRAETGSDELNEYAAEERKYWYVCGYEAGGRERSAELADELTDE